MTTHQDIVTAAGFAIGTPGNQQTDAEAVGALAAAPSSGSVSVSVERFGPNFRLTFTLTAARVPVTDGTTSGSHGSLKLFDFAQQAIAFLGCRQNYTAIAEGAALTTANDDAVYEIGVGTTAISAAADGALGATEDDIGGDINMNHGSSHAGAAVTGPGAAADGTGAAGSINLNVSGSAATIDATSYLDVTGTITVSGTMLGDD